MNPILLPFHFVNIVLIIAIVFLACCCRQEEREAIAQNIQALFGSKTPTTEIQNEEEPSKSSGEEEEYQSVKED